MNKYKRLAVFGGTFSPVHNGHVHAMRGYYNIVKPDIMYVIPTAVPPHKARQDTASDAERLDMLRLALNELPGNYNIIVSDIEIRRGGKSYTLDTVRELCKISDEVVIYCGTDMLLTFEEWYCFEDILKLATVAYMQRESDFRNAGKIEKKVAYFRERYGARMIGLREIPFEISSREIRGMVNRGEDISAFVPPAVCAYIAQHGLYGEKHDGKL